MSVIICEFFSIIGPLAEVADLIGIVYIYFVPESVTERLTLSAKHQSRTDDDDIDKQSLCQKLNKAIKDGNRTLL